MLDKYTEIMRKKIDDLIAQVPLKIFAVTLLFIIALVLFAYIADEIVLENNSVFDTQVMNYVHTHETLQLIQIMKVVTFFGSSQFLLPAYILLIIFYVIKKNTAYAIDIAIIGISSTAIMFLLKGIFKRHRPPMPIVKTIVGYSFPSGHSLSSFIFCSILVYLIFQSSLTRTLKYLISLLLLLFALTIGLSRIVLNVHFASDVIAGFCLGLVLVIVSFNIMRKIRKANPATADTPLL